MPGWGVIDEIVKILNNFFDTEIVRALREASGWTELMEFDENGSSKPLEQYQHLDDLPIYIYLYDDPCANNATLYLSNFLPLKKNYGIEYMVDAEEQIETAERLEKLAVQLRAEAARQTASPL